MVVLKIIPEALPNLALQSGFKLLPLFPDEVTTYHELKDTWHRDPFDMAGYLKNITLISKDENIAKYASAGLKLLW